MNTSTCGFGKTRRNDLADWWAVQRCCFQALDRDCCCSCKWKKKKMENRGYLLGLSILHLKGPLTQTAVTIKITMTITTVNIWSGSKKFIKVALRQEQVVQNSCVTLKKGFYPL